MTNPATSQSSVIPNSKQKYLPEVVQNLTDKQPEDGDFTEPNLTQQDKKQMVPIHDENGYAVTMSLVKVKQEKTVLDEEKYKIGMGKWSMKYYSINRISYNDIKPVVEWKTREKILHGSGSNNAWYNRNINQFVQTGLIKLQGTSSYEAVSLIMVTIINNQPDTKLIDGTKWANTR